jgi:uracil-DNA glycosylase family protein
MGHGPDAHDSALDRLSRRLHSSEAYASKTQGSRRGLSRLRSLVERDADRVRGRTQVRRRDPFVGPAGKLLDAALLQAGIDRSRVYVTNSVKHFKFVPIERGRRLHKKPNAAEIRACHPWLEEEIRLVKPRVVVALGATAAQVLLGKDFRVTRDRGKPMPSELAETVVATVHPSSILRAPDDTRDEARREFIADLKQVAEYLTRSAT